MALDAEPKYPSRRTYVLRVRSDATPDRLAGRLENLITGEKHEFSTGTELIESIAFELYVKFPDDPLSR